MSPPANDAGMDTRVALIEKEFGMVHGIFQRFESALEKMSEVSMNMQKLLAVHDQRIAERERAETALFENLERRREEYTRHVEGVARKMEQMGSDLKAQLREEVGELADDVKESLKKIETSTEATNTKIKDMEARVRQLENWRWLMVGGGAVVGAILAKWSAIASIFGGGA